MWALAGLPSLPTEDSAHSSWQGSGWPSPGMLTGTLASPPPQSSHVHLLFQPGHLCPDSLGITHPWEGVFGLNEWTSHYVEAEAQRSRLSAASQVLKNVRQR